MTMRYMSLTGSTRREAVALFDRGRGKDVASLDQKEETP